MEELKSCFISSVEEYREGAVHLFEQKISLEGSDIKKAVLNITALGLFEAEINGEKVGEDLFTPGFTYYHRHLLYRTYEVSDMLKKGTNSLRVYLGQGWYCGRFTFDNLTQIYGDQSAVSWILDMDDGAGNRKRTTSGDDNVKELLSPYEYAGFYDGEIYSPKKDSYSEIGKPVPFSGKIPEVIEKPVTRVRYYEEMQIKEVIGRDGFTILDFGQNFSGIAEIDPSLLDGDFLHVRHGEILDKYGNLYTNNLRQAKAEIKYYKSDEKDIYLPKFTYMGFRYMELSGCPYVEGLIKTYAIHTEMERTGHFKCDNKLVEKLYENQLWGQRSNYIEVPTDCPQRDERMGYTGDGHVFALTGSYNYDTEAFWEKFLKDIRYSQMDNSEGYIGSTIPANGPGGFGFLSMLGWGNAVTIIPNMLYQQYGEKRHLIDQYGSMQRFVEAEMRKMGKKHLWIGPSLGDWLMPGKSTGWMAMHNHPVSNAFIVNDLRILSELAGSLGKTEDQKRYGDQLGRTRMAYIKKFIRKNGRMKDDYQGAYIMALKFVVEDRDLRKKMLAHLLDNIRKKGMDTGFFSTQHILPLLADEGETELAFDLLLQEECPGWMYQINQGATTTWERWDALRPDGSVNETKMKKDNMVSFNHYAFGSVGEFYYRYILGINPLEPGYARVLVQPRIDRRLGKVEGTYNSRVGEIYSAWKIEGDKVDYHIRTPRSGRIVLANGYSHKVEAGEYFYAHDIL